MLQTPPWPVPGPRLAWTPPGPNPSVVAVPLEAEDLRRPLTLDRYWELLTDRLAWMLERDDDPLASAARMANEMADLGCWMGGTRFPTPREAAEALVLLNPSFLRVLMLLNPLDGRGPWTALNQPRARAAIEETSLTDWLDLLLPAAGNLN